MMARPLPNDLDEELFGELAAIFRRITPDRVRELKNALAEQDWKVAGRMAHTMKSSSAQLGLWGLSQVCRKMEEKGLGGDPTDWAPLLEEFSLQVNQALNELPLGPAPFEPRPPEAGV